MEITILKIVLRVISQIFLDLMASNMPNASNPTVKRS